MLLIDAEEAKKTSSEELLKKLETGREGLSSDEARKRLEAVGPNAIQEEKKSLIFKIFSYFWGPIPWMIEIAAALSAIDRQWADFFVIFALLFVNGLVGFWEEYQAGNAIEALKKKLALKSVAKRDGKWAEIDAHQLVPGDIILIRLGNIIPADGKLIEGDFLSVDQSALTGESLPVSKKNEDFVYAGSIAKQGEMSALITSTGQNTFFGKTTKLAEKAKPTSHLQKAILKIGNYLIYLSLGLTLLLVSIQLARHTPFLELVQFVLILIVASIPVAMPAIISVTMALGALLLSKMKAVVTRLESIEEIAGIDILCCDKTGTLTENKLSLEVPVTFKNMDGNAAILYGALASKEETQDPIDLAILKGVKNPEELKNFKRIKFIPFDPVSKKSEAIVQDGKGNAFHAVKGAPQIILSLCHPDQAYEKEVYEAIDRLGKKGSRTLGVARSQDGKSWEFLGLLPLSDPLRSDTAETIAHAKEHGIDIKMLTGDNISIASEIANQLHLEGKICVIDELLSKNKDFSDGEISEKIEKSPGFAQVFPEHKYDIIKALQKKRHIVGMTGDGVNDAPALKQADVGIAVSGATDAARSSASLVLLEPGLSVIINAIEEARKIFERMTSYAIYRIAETIRIMLFIVSSILIFNFYPVTAILIILLAMLNDIPIIAIAYDNALLSKKPVRWQIKRVLIISTALGGIGIIASFILLTLAKDVLLLSLEQIQSFIFLKLSVAGHQTLFVARAKGAFFSKPYPSKTLLIAILATQTFAAMLVGFGWFVTPISWTYILLIWVYALVWMGIADAVKVRLYRHFKVS